MLDDARVWAPLVLRIQRHWGPSVVVILQAIADLIAARGALRQWLEQQVGAARAEAGVVAIGRLQLKRFQQRARALRILLEGWNARSQRHEQAGIRWMASLDRLEDDLLHQSQELTERLSIRAQLRTA